MVEFLRPWAFVLLPLPILIWTVIPATQRRAALVVPPRIADLLIHASGPKNPSHFSHHYRWWLAGFGWLCLIGALSAPLTEDEPLQAVSGRDLLLALDLSASMSVKDVTLDGESVDRFTAVKTLAASFIEGRAGDRVGLIVFADETYLIAPLTFDVNAVAGFLDEVVVGLPGKKTAIGDAIGLSIKTLQEQPLASRVIVLLSDGDSNAGIIVPDAAAQLAARHQIRVHTIGFGQADDAETTHSELTHLAESTGGRHYVAVTTQALREVYLELDRLEPTEADNPGQIAEKDWVQELLLMALITLFILCVLDIRHGRL